MINNCDEIYAFIIKNFSLFYYKEFVKSERHRQIYYRNYSNFTLQIVISGLFALKFPNNFDKVGALYLLYQNQELFNQCKIESIRADVVGANGEFYKQFSYFKEIRPEILLEIDPALIMYDLDLFL